MIYILTSIIILALILTLIFHSRNTLQNATIPIKKSEIDPLFFDISDIDKMDDGSEFEMYLYRLLLELGYKGVFKTVGSRDFGADLVFIDRSGTRNVIQAKRYSIENPVGISAVQEVYSSMRYYKAKKSIVITSSTFTGSCETLAGVNYVKLLDRKDLIEIIDLFKQGNLENVKNIIESEPRMILDSWSEYTDDDLKIKTDKKAEQMVMSR
ncbi:restriction endonuclease [Brevibacillus sp. Leaf182]|uniref:restriction endonuclease n=1 Tax=Brevibacillus sp. Leaf182 TaxID=1736290 RepID=UPI00070076AA|nr:restriction endonuclease [Brevibacillus sp. Leaf182]RAT97857.1 restriction endonuclease [Brevibacillus sp. Leaf182]